MASLTVGGVVLTLTLLATLFGNGLVLYLLAKPERRLLKRPLYLFIVNLCVADVAVAVFSMPFKIVDEIGQDWVFGCAMCKIVEYSQRSLFRVNVLTHLFIATDRYFSVVFPLKPQMTIKKAKRMMIAAWVFSFLFSIPFFFAFVTETKDNIQLCKLVGLPWWMEKTHTAIDLFLSFLVPVGILLWLYASIIWCLNRRKRQSADIGSIHASLTTIRASIRGVRVSMVVVIVFTICWIPVIVKSFSRLSHEQNVNTDRTDALYATAMYFAFFNDALVPLLYCGLDSNLQPAARKLFPCFPAVASVESLDQQDGTMN